MDNKLEGVSEGTVEAVKRAIYHQEPIVIPDSNADESGEWTREIDYDQLDEEDLRLIECQAQAAITALLASGEVVLKADVPQVAANGDVVERVARAIEDNWDWQRSVKPGSDFCNYSLLRSVSTLLAKAAIAALTPSPDKVDAGGAYTDLMLRRANMKEALCEFAEANGANFEEVTLVEKDVSEGTNIRYEYSIQKTTPNNTQALHDALDPEGEGIIKLFWAADHACVKRPGETFDYINQEDVAIINAALARVKVLEKDVARLVEAASNALKLADKSHASTKGAREFWAAMSALQNALASTPKAPHVCSVSGITCDGGK